MIVNRPVFLSISLVFLCAWGSTSQAKNFCFVKAETYYEQLYCEVVAKGNGRYLPDFLDFRKNEPLIQALLLKKPAARSGLELVMPIRKSKPIAQKREQAEIKASLEKHEAEATVNITRKITGKLANTESSNGLNECQLVDELINCSQRTYQLTGNKNNNKLPEGALSEGNLMGLVPYQNALKNTEALNDYLFSSYQRYVRKMLDIGLGGVTMSLGKFSHLFQDFTDRGLNFNDRFETMYRYLRKDKRSIRVDESVSIDSPIQLDNCLDLKNDIISCVSAKRNYLFVRAI